MEPRTNTGRSQDTAFPVNRTIGLPARGDKSQRDLRNFGIFMGVALPVLAALLRWRFGIGIEAVAALTVAGAPFLILGLTRPESLRAIEHGWMVVGERIGVVVTFVVMCLTFFAVITPIGLLMRAFGKDPLERSFDRERASYWEPVPPDGPGTRPWLPF